MAREKDPAEIIETIAQSIRVSQRGARRVRAHRFKELFGYQVLNSQRRERIERLMAEAGIEVRPSLEDARRDDWLVMSMPVEVPVAEASPDPAPTAEWFAHMASVRTATEREVEMHFASPLFREGLGYSEEQEAAGFGIRWARGSTPGHVEADLLYFAGDKHDVKAGEPLVLVECKRLIKDEKELQAAVAQAHSYALWVIPAYYVITDGRIVSVWDFQGAVAPDRELLRVSQGELAGSFDDLYSRLNPRAAAAARHARSAAWRSPGENRATRCSCRAEPSPGARRNRSGGRPDEPVRGTLHANSRRPGGMAPDRPSDGGGPGAAAGPLASGEGADAGHVGD